MSSSAWSAMSTVTPALAVSFGSSVEAERCEGCLWSGGEVAATGTYGDELVAHQLVGADVDEVAG